MLCLHCDLSEILEQTRPPDPELVDLIERAFLEGQIDSRKGPRRSSAVTLLKIL